MVDERDAVMRQKARIVAQGLTQKYGNDYDEVFAPVTKQVTFRTLLTVASQRKAVIKHVDVKTAYLNGELEETIFTRQPEGYATGDDRVCRSRRSLYGLKQSSHVWIQKVDSVFVTRTEKQRTSSFMWTIWRSLRRLKKNSSKF